jgi:hypothetical protein
VADDLSPIVRAPDDRSLPTRLDLAGSLEPRITVVRQAANRFSRERLLSSSADTGVPIDNPRMALTPTNNDEQPADSSHVPERVSSAIILLRGQRVILDTDLAELYGVQVKTLVQAVKRNPDRFPSDFMFHLGKQEVARLRSQFVTSNGRGGRRYAPYAFTEQGVAMLSSVLRSRRAVHVNIEIVRAFVRLRAMLASNDALARKLAELEAKYDSQFRAVFDAIRELMARPTLDPSKRPIGFVSSE